MSWVIGVFRFLTDTRPGLWICVNGWRSGHWSIVCVFFGVRGGALGQENRQRGHRLQDPSGPLMPPQRRHMDRHPVTDHHTTGGQPSSLTPRWWLLSHWGINSTTEITKLCTNSPLVCFTLSSYLFTASSLSYYRAPLNTCVFSNRLELGWFNLTLLCSTLFYFTLSGTLHPTLY